MIRESRVRYNGVRTRALTTDGAGVPILLLHGFADCADTWHGVLAELDRRGRAAVAVDVVGHGVAGAFAPGPLLAQLDRFVDGVLETTGPVVVAGNSLGAMMAVRAAQRRPESVRAVVTLDEPILSADRMARLARGARTPALVARLGTLPVPAGLARRLVRRSARTLLYGRPAGADPVVLDRWCERYGQRERMFWLLEHAVRFAHETVAGYSLDAIDCPMLIVHGRKDRIIPPQASRELHRLVPGSELIILPTAGHCPQLDDPAAVAALIADFADAQRSARTAK
ncbi:alpha/beta fold hydrolase [Nocardia violaceofusca]|uniref:alpha/beta fold hydrolase n=1 Tax=Nocardia violaceofusca TaxID=941182 RepID=UPI0007A46357|nr:alpha/beta hydrolase [Nocardia violaceofusca]